MVIWKIPADEPEEDMYSLGEFYIDTLPTMTGRRHNWQCH
jgi:hypothetical protein